MYKNLKALRQSLNMSQKEFAASLGIGYTTYNGYETGAREPKSDFWMAVARKYEVSIDYLMGYTDEPQGYAVKPSNIDPILKKRMEIIASEYQNVPGKDELIKMLLNLDPVNRFAALEFLIRVLTMVAWSNIPKTSMDIVDDGETPPVFPTRDLQLSPAPQEGKDTTPATDSPERPPEGE